MQQWEYKTLQLPLIGGGEESHNRTLESLGLDGWEMVGIAHFDKYYRAWFKRSKSSPEPYR